jgi:hypothetical protein
VKKPPRKAKEVVLPLPVVPDVLIVELCAVDSAARMLSKGIELLLAHAKGRPSARAIADLMTSARRSVDAWAAWVAMHADEETVPVGAAEGKGEGLAVFKEVVLAIGELSRAIDEVEARYMGGTP